jgi:hypothetical protein
VLDGRRIGVISRGPGGLRGRGVACLLSVLAGALVLGSDPSQGREPAFVQGIENAPSQPSVLILDDGSRLQTMLFEVRVLGTLKTVREKLYLVLAGRGCRECDANISIYIHSPGDGSMRNEATQPRYSYPGRETSYEDGKTVLFEARAFLGDCLPAHDNAVVWYEGFRTEAGLWVSGVFVATVRNDELKNIRLEPPLPRVSETLQRVRTGRCREIKGIERHSEP